MEVGDIKFLGAEPIYLSYVGASPEIEFLGSEPVLFMGYELPVYEVEGTHILFESLSNSGTLEYVEVNYPVEGTNVLGVVLAQTGDLEYVEVNYPIEGSHELGVVLTCEGTLNYIAFTIAITGSHDLGATLTHEGTLDYIEVNYRVSGSYSLGVILSYSGSLEEDRVTLVTADFPIPAKIGGGTGGGIGILTGKIAFGLYTTGGETVEAITRLFKSGHRVLCDPEQGYLFEWDKTNKKIKVYISSTGAEVGNGVNLAALNSVSFIATGLM